MNEYYSFLKYLHSRKVTTAKCSIEITNQNVFVVVVAVVVVVNNVEMSAPIPRR